MPTARSPVQRSRFGELPKPLAPLGGRPLLDRQLEWLAGHGVRDVVLCVGHGAEQVRQTLGDGGRLGALRVLPGQPADAQALCTSAPRAIL